MRRLKTGRRPPIYPKTPGHLPCSSLTQPLPLSSRRPSVSFGGFGLRGTRPARHLAARHLVDGRRLRAAERVDNRHGPAFRHDSAMPGAVADRRGHSRLQGVRSASARHEAEAVAPVHERRVSPARAWGVSLESGCPSQTASSRLGNADRLSLYICHKVWRDIGTCKPGCLTGNR